MAAFKMASLTVMSLVSVAFCNDLRAGYPDSRQNLIFAQKIDYNPSIYVRSEVVTAVAPGNQVISNIEVIDERELKDGEATILTGGVGQRTVDIQLKGPAVFRGMTFLVKVYAVDSNAYGGTKVGDHYSGQPATYGAKSGYAYDQLSQDYNNRYGIKQ